MWDTVDDALKLRPPYNAGDFRSAIEAAEGVFERRAKTMLREHIHSGLVHLAKHRDKDAIKLSMEAVILNETRWHGLFNQDEICLCKDRLELARALAK